MTEYVNGNGSTTRLVYWLLGIFALVFVAGVSFIFSNMIQRLDGLDHRETEVQLSVSGMKEVVKQVDDLVKEVRKEQVDRTFKFGDLGAKITGLEMKISIMDAKYTSIQENVSALKQQTELLNQSKKSK